MRWLTRTTGLLTVLFGAVIALVFTTPLPSRPAPVRTDSPFAPTEGLPADWPKRLVGNLVKQRPPMGRTELLGLLQTVDRAARRFGLDPLVVLAVIQVESEFDPQAISPRGAMGLMQLRAETARDLALSLGLPCATDDGLLAPETNVLLGTFYLRQLVDRFGSVEAALAAYHAGPSKIEDLRDRREGIPDGYSGRIRKVFADLQTRSLT